MNSFSRSKTNGAMMFHRKESLLRRGVFLFLLFVGLLLVLYSSSLNFLVGDEEEDIIHEGRQPNETVAKTIPFKSELAVSNILIITSLSNDSSHFAAGAIKLISSIKQNGSPPQNADYAIIIPADHPVTDSRTVRELRAVGWSFLHFPCLLPSSVRREQASDGCTTATGIGILKLHLWNLTTYDRVVFLESDCLVVGSLAGLLRLDLAARPLWLPSPGGAWAGASDAGVMVLRPDAAEFARLRAQALQPGTADASEVAFLRRVFGRRCGDMRFADGADLAAYTGDPGLWRRQAAEGLQVIRYTVRKPWACPPGDAYDAVCRLWREVVVTVPCEVTLVTSYYRVPSKHTHEEYLAWMQMVLSLDACLVIVTDTANEGLFRGRYPRYTSVLTVPLEEAALRLNRTVPFWAGQVEMDQEKETHKGYMLYWVWALKPVFLRDAVLRNSFGSRFFFWVDVGCLRKGTFLGRTLQSPPPQVLNGPTSVYFSAVNNFTQRDLRLRPDGTAATSYFMSRLAGAIWGGRAAAVLAFHDAYFRAFNRQADAGVFVGKDQNVMNIACIENRGLCMMVLPNPLVYNIWYYMMPFLLGDTPWDVPIPVGSVGSV